MIDGKEIFNLVDRHGLPLDIIVLELKDRNQAFNVIQFIDAAIIAGWSKKRIKIMLESAQPTPKKAIEIIDKYLKFHTT